MCYYRNVFVKATHLAWYGSFREEKNIQRVLSIQALSFHKDNLYSWFWKCLMQGFKSMTKILFFLPFLKERNVFYELTP